MKKTIFTGAATAIITPMKSDGSVDYEMFEKLIEFQISEKIDALVVCGTTGESSTLTDDEHIELIRFACKVVGHRVPVIAGTGSNDTGYAISLTKEAKAVGADASLQVTPYYNKTSQRGLVNHFTAIADAADLPVILYNVPSRTGMTINPSTYLELSKHPNIVATKEASGNFSAIAKTISLCGDNLDVYSGNDDQIIPMLSLGGKGVISVLANIAPKDTAMICKLWSEGKIEESRNLQLEYMELIDALFMDVNPIPVKTAVTLLGYSSGDCRLPLANLSVQDMHVLKKAMENKKLI